MHISNEFRRLEYFTRIKSRATDKCKKIWNFNYFLQAPVLEFHEMQIEEAFLEI